MNRKFYRRIGKRLRHKTARRAIANSNIAVRLIKGAIAAYRRAPCLSLFAEDRNIRHGASRWISGALHRNKAPGGVTTPHQGEAAPGIFNINLETQNEAV